MWVEIGCLYLRDSGTASLAIAYTIITGTNGPPPMMETIGATQSRRRGKILGNMPVRLISDGAGHPVE